MKNYPLVSIIIVNYNGKEHLEKCLKSLAKIDYQNFEIILIDNNSSDGSIMFVEKNYPDVKIIQLDHNYGFAEPNNIAANGAKGDFLLFLNNDTIVTPNFVTELVKIAEQDPQTAIFQSLLLNPDGSIDSAGDYMDILGSVYNSKIRPTIVRPILSARGASMMVRKEKFWDLGGFDRFFFASFEDVDLGWRAWISGYKTVIVPNSVVYHTGSQTIKQLTSMISFHGVKNILIIRFTNFETSYAIRSIIEFSLIILVKKLFGISIARNIDQTSTLPSLKTIFKGIGWVCKNFRYILRKRKEVNSKRVNSTRDLIQMGLITSINIRN